MTSEWRRSRFLYPLLIIAVLTAVYVPLILQQNDFRTDDYYLLTLVKEHGLVSPFDGVRYSYFSAFRLVPMLSLLLDYHAYGPHALGFYLFNLILHIATVLLFFALLKLLFPQLFDYTGQLLPFLIALSLGLHADLFYNVLWICNRTEGLLLFFYLGAVYSWLLYFFEQQRRWYVIGLISCILALLSKEQAIHLPLIFILIGAVMNRLRSGTLRWRSVVVAAIPLAAVTVALLILRWIFDPGASFMAGFLTPKKVFSIVGINLIAFHPTLAKPVFIYFYEHKLIAGMIGLTVSAVGVFSILRSSSRTRMTLLSLVLFFIVISFPRVFYHVFPRINSIQVVFLLFVSGIILLHMRPRWMTIAVLLLLTGQVAGMYYELHHWRHETSNERYEVLLKQDREPSQQRYTLLTHYHDHARYVLHFLRHGDFGADTTVRLTPLYLDRRYGTRQGTEFSIRRQGPRLNFTSTDPRVVFQYDSTAKLPAGFTIELSDPAADYGFRKAKVEFSNVEPRMQYLIERNDAFEFVSLNQ